MTAKTKIKERRRRRLLRGRKDARKMVANLRSFEKGVRRIHPELATPANMEELRRLSIQLARAARVLAKSQILLIRTYAAINEAM